MKRSFGWFLFIVLSTVNEKLIILCVLSVLNDPAETGEWAVNVKRRIFQYRLITAFLQELIDSPSNIPVDLAA